jgi:quinol monooxygenase YgiN
LSEIVVIGHLRAKPGRAADLLALLSELIPPVLNSEPGLQRYAFYVEPESDPLRVTVIEKYATSTDLPAPDTVELRPAPLTLTVSETDATRLTI